MSTIRFHQIEGGQEALRAIVAHIRASVPPGVTALPPWPQAHLEGCGLESSDDLLMLRIELASNRRATVQLLVTQLRGLIVNHVMMDAVTGNEPPSPAQSSEVMTIVFEHCLLPAFEMVPGVAMVVQRGDELVRFGPGKRPPA